MSSAARIDAELRASGSFAQSMFVVVEELSAGG
jgi:hypothetical protein